MTLNEAKLLHAYNSWADNRIFEALAQLPPEQYMQDMHTSHGSIHGALTHSVFAQKIWLDRFRGLPTSAMPKPEEIPTFGALKEIWGKVGFETSSWLGGMSDKKLQETFSMKTLKGNTQTHVYWQAFQHLVNHSSYHRGQIVAMLRQLGTKPPATDMILFYRESNKLP